MTPDRARHPAAPAPGDALLIVDMQNDFMPGGALAVAGADAIVAVLNRYAARFAWAGLPVLATRDWHPADHGSFRAQGGVWPVHCVAATAGARFVDGLALPAQTIVVDKGQAVAGDGYSGFESAQLRDALRRAGCRRLFIGGVATEFCVLQTASDARRLGYAVVLLTDAIRAVDAAQGAAALERLRRLGATTAVLADLDPAAGGAGGAAP